MAEDAAQSRVTERTVAHCLPVSGVALRCEPPNDRVCEGPRDPLVDSAWKGGWGVAARDVTVRSTGSVTGENIRG